MRAFVINLERSTIRRSYMQQQLESFGIPFEFIKAVDGATLTDDYLAKVCDFKKLAERPHLLYKGMYGCVLSHYSIYQRIIAEDLPYAVILEDDITIQPGLKELLAKLETTIQSDEAILLFTQNNYMPTVLSKQESEQLPGNYKLSYPMEPWALGSTAGYVIGREAAQHLLDFVLPMRYGPDAWGTFYYEKAIRSIRCVTPFPVMPAGFKSDIDYVANTSLAGRISSFVNEHNIFPFKQLLDMRRRRLLKKTAQISFTSDPSPVAAQLQV